MSDAEIEQDIQAKGLTAARVTPQRIAEVIADEFYFTAAQGVIGRNHTEGQVAVIDPTGTLALLTICVLVLKNGFTVTGESACASPENFNAEIGRKIARTHAVDKIWALEGYVLKQRLHDRQTRESQFGTSDGDGSIFETAAAARAAGPEVGY